MSLDFKSFADAANNLEDALVWYDRVLAENHPQLQKHMRASVIQAFETTYEITFKMLRRHLEKKSDSPETIKGMSFNDVIREAFSQDLVCSDLSVWRDYRKNRNITSHTYNEDRAQEVFECALDFLQDARYTLAKLQEENIDQSD